MAFLKVDLELLSKTNMSRDSVLLYSYLLQLKGLSIKNKVTDADGKTVVYCTVEKVMELLNVSKPTAVKLFKELVAFNLIRRVRRGLTKASYIYINEDINEEEVEKVDKEEAQEEKNTDISIYKAEQAYVSKDTNKKHKNEYNKERAENLFEKIKSVLFFIVQKRNLQINNSILIDIANKIISKNYKINHLHHYLNTCVDNLLKHTTLKHRSSYTSFPQRNYSDEFLNGLETRLLRS